MFAPVVMSSYSFSKTRRLLVVTVSALCLCGAAGKAEAKTRTLKAPVAEQQAPVTDPLVYPNAPLRAGALTMEDVLEAHRNRTKAAKTPSAETQTPSATATAPVLAPPSGSSTTGLMVSQGMKAVLQKLGPDKLAPPPTAAAGTLQAPALPEEPPALQKPQALVPGAKYQPGQEPKNLLTGKPIKAPPSIDSFVSLTAPAASAKEKSVLALPCKPSVQKWEKSCEEAGYPATFVGKILGETRIDCKADDALHDFWVSNTCAPPGSSEAEAAKEVSKEELADAKSETPEVVEGECGSADGKAYKTAPAADLCVSGTASAVEGSGPWTWSCEGSRKGLTERCSARVVEEERVVEKEQEEPVPVAERQPQPVLAEPEPERDAVRETEAVVPSAPRVVPSAPRRAVPSSSADDDIVMSPELIDELTGGVTIAEDSLPASERKAAAARVESKVAEPEKAESKAKAAEAFLRPERKPELTAAKAAPKAAAKSRDAAPPKPEPKQEPTPEPLDEPQAASAPVAPTPSPAPGNDELCGMASEMLATEAPNKNLCRAGTPSPVNGDGPWTWSCTNNEGVVSTCRTLTLSKASKPARTLPESSMVKAAPRVKVEAAKPLPSSGAKAVDANKPGADTPQVAKTGHMLPAEPPSAKKDDTPKTAEKASGNAQTLPDKPAVNGEDSRKAKARLSLDPALSALPFAKGTDTIGKDALSKLAKLATTLKENPEVRISLISHADSSGSSPRDAHRLSLNRALNVRGYLSSHGVNESRMDISAMGSEGPDGTADRVDVKVYE